MRKLFLDKELVSVKEICQPLLDDHSVLISVAYSYLALGEECCQASSSLSFVNSVPQKIKQMLSIVTHRDDDQVRKCIQEKITDRVLMGASCSGMVIGMGKKVNNFRIGDFVACAGDEFIDHAGIICVPENLVVRLPDQDHLKNASLIGFGAMAMQSIRRAEIQLGDSVCVIGLCSLGQLIVQLCKASGAEVTAVDSVAYRRELAKKSGATQVFDSNESHLQKTLESVSHGHGFDKVIISPDTSFELLADLALNITRRKGKIVLIANNQVHFKKDDACHKEVDILFTYFFGPGRCDQSYEVQGTDYPYAFVRWTENRNMQLFADMILQNKVNLDVLLNNNIKTSQLQSTQVLNKESVGLVIEYDYIVEEIQKKEIVNTFVPSKNDVLSVSFLGATRYVRNNILPAFAKIKGVAVNKIIDKDLSCAVRAAKMYRGAVAATDEHCALDAHRSTDAVFFSVPHNASFNNILLALKNNKIVFADHPVAINDEQLEQLDEVFHENPESRLFVCYNRIHAPFIQKMKRELDRSVIPNMIFYRVNLAAMDKTQRYLDRNGSVIAYASHVIDVLCYLINAKPVSISVETLSQAEHGVFPADNFTAIISFANGSIGNIMFTSLGSDEGCAERIEAFFDGKSIVMEDFTRLTGFGLPQSFDEMACIPDKGYEAMFQEYLSQVKHPTTDIRRYLRRWNIVRRLTSVIDTLACQGGGETRLN